MLTLQSAINEDETNSQDKIELSYANIYEMKINCGKAEFT